VTGNLYFALFIATVAGSALGARAVSIPMWRGALMAILGIALAFFLSAVIGVSSLLLTGVACLLFAALVGSALRIETRKIADIIAGGVLLQLAAYGVFTLF